MNGFLKPVRDQDCEWLSKADNDEYILCNVKKLKPRNAKFFRKYFAMLNFAYDHFEPEAIETKYGTPEKSRERFRKDLTVLAGYYNPTYKIDGTLILEAKSIAWNNMEEEEFKAFYTATFNAIAKHIFSHYSADQLKEVEQALWGF